MWNLALPILGKAKTRSDHGSASDSKKAIAEETASTQPLPSDCWQFERGSAVLWAEWQLGDPILRAG